MGILTNRYPFFLWGEFLKSRKTLYQLVYDDLKKQIQSGALEYKSSLPSIRQLSLYYHVSTVTVKKALKLLREEQMIQTEERKNTVIIYKPLFSERGYIQSILRREASILAVYETMEIIMPDILAFCTKSVNVTSLEHYEQAHQKRSKKHQGPGRWRTASLLLHDLLKKSGNLLFDPLLTRIESYGEVSFFLDHQQPISEYSPYEDNHTITWVLNHLQNADHHTIKKNFSESYHLLTQSVRKSFEKLREKFPDVPFQDEKRFAWNSREDFYPLYQRIARDVVEKIGTGIYPQDQFLPSEASLAVQYGVSVSTIRRALKSLCHLGFTQTYNGLGSKVVSVDKQDFWRKMSRQNIQLYLSALQLMMLIVRPAALLAFDRLDGSVQHRLKLSQSKKNSILLQELIDCITEQISLYPLKSILQECCQIISLGVYYSYYKHGSQNADHLTLMSSWAFHNLLDGEREKFADQIHLCYRFIFCSVHSTVEHNGLSDAVDLMIPE